MFVLQKSDSEIQSYDFFFNFYEFYVSPVTSSSFSIKQEQAEIIFEADPLFFISYSKFLPSKEFCIRLEFELNSKVRSVLEYCPPRVIFPINTSQIEAELKYPLESTKTLSIIEPVESFFISAKVVEDEDVVKLLKFATISMLCPESPSQRKHHVLVREEAADHDDEEVGFKEILRFA